MTRATRAVTRTVGVAGQIAFTVTTATPNGDDTTTYVGSIYGVPGPITIIFAPFNTGLHFDAPERFGATFDRAWIDAVLAEADRNAALLELD